MTVPELSALSFMALTAAFAGHAARAVPIL